MSRPSAGILTPALFASFLMGILSSSGWAADSEYDPAFSLGSNQFDLRNALMDDFSKDICRDWVQGLEWQSSIIAMAGNELRQEVGQLIQFETTAIACWRQELCRVFSWFDFELYNVFHIHSPFLMDLQMYCGCLGMQGNSGAPPQSAISGPGPSPSPSPGGSPPKSVASAPEPSGLALSAISLLCLALAGGLRRYWSSAPSLS
jgi:hypothetical protein